MKLPVCMASLSVTSASLKTAVPRQFSLATSASAFQDIPDAHAVSVVASHYGLPLGGIKIRKYDIHGLETQVNAEPLQRYKTDLDSMVALL